MPVKQFTAAARAAFKRNCAVPGEEIIFLGTLDLGKPYRPLDIFLAPEDYGFMTISEGMTGLAREKNWSGYAGWKCNFDKFQDYKFELSTAWITTDDAFGKWFIPPEVIMLGKSESWDRTHVFNGNISDNLYKQPGLAYSFNCGDSRGEADYQKGTYATCSSMSTYYSDGQDFRVARFKNPYRITVHTTSHDIYQTRPAGGVGNTHWRAEYGYRPRYGSHTELMHRHASKYVGLYSHKCSIRPCMALPVPAGDCKR